jgi:hypothetical protein
VINKLRGILDPLPMAPIAAANADVTIAVSLSGSEAGGRYEPTDTEPRATTEWLNRMWRSTTALFGPSHRGRRYPPICSSRCHEPRAEASNSVGPQR